ncbi:MAG: F0F1 ATP synthase subunit delta [Candidatus Saccharimonadales bacterium]
MGKTSRTRIASVIADHTLRHGGSEQYAKEIAAYLISERRVDGLDSIMRDVMDDWSKVGHLEVLAFSAHPLTPALKDQITEQIRAVSSAAKDIIITEVYDAKVIGGVRLRLANRQLDLSVENKLNEFKQLTGAGKE